MREDIVVQWLRHGKGTLAQALCVTLERVGVRLRADDAAARELAFEQLFMRLHDVDHSTPRDTAKLTLSFLATRLATAFGVGSGAVNLPMLCVELRETVRLMGVRMQASGVVHSTLADDEGEGDPLTALAAALEAQLSGQKGTQDSPFALPGIGTVPLNERRTKGYATLAFPTLFPFGVGDFSQTRKHELTWSQWTSHLLHYRDGRFATHRRFPYFLLNTHERDTASRMAGLFVRESGVQLTVGDLRKMSAKDKQEVAKNVYKYGATLRNTPAFMGERRKELQSMCEQIGDPSVRASPRLPPPPPLLPPPRLLAPASLCLPSAALLSRALPCPPASLLARSRARWRYLAVPARAVVVRACCACLRCLRLPSPPF